MALNTQQERQNWYCKESDMIDMVNSIKENIRKIRVTLKNKENKIIQLNKEIIELKEIIKKYEDDNNG